MTIFPILLAAASLAVTAALIIGPILALILLSERRFNGRHHDHLNPGTPRSPRG